MHEPQNALRKEVAYAVHIKTCIWYRFPRKHVQNQISKTYTVQVSDVHVDTRIRIAWMHLQVYMLVESRNYLVVHCLVEGRYICVCRSLCARRIFPRHERVPAILT